MNVPFVSRTIQQSDKVCAVRRIEIRSVERAIARAILIALLVAVGGCSKAVAPTPVVVAAPPPPPEPVVVVQPAITSWTIPATFASTWYLTEVSATLETDSLGHAIMEHVETRALIALQGRRDSLGGLRANGQVDSFTVRGLERALLPLNQSDKATTAPLAAVPASSLAVAFDASIEAHNIRVTTRPPLANECDRAESGATNLVRELLIRVPKTLSVGTTWRDSTAGFRCRLGVPITSFTRASYVVDRMEKVSGRTMLIVRRSTETQLDGNLKSSWRTLSITGTGRATQNIRIDAVTGVIQSIDGDGTLILRLNDSARRDGQGTQEVRQTTKSRTSLHK
ncbi:MAG: hypothetical protein ABJC26_07765 [Gemmatimonadaceae bacterium]